MKNEIKLIKNNADKKWDDIEWLDEFYKFLQGDLPEKMRMSSHMTPKLTQKKAFAIIWYLQEHLPVFPDNVERCDGCGELFDSYSEGLYWESKRKHYCGECEYLVPVNYDNNQRGV